MPTDPLIEMVTRWWNELTRLADDRLEVLARLRKLLDDYVKATQEEARARIAVAIEDLLEKAAPDLLEYLERQTALRKGMESVYRGGEPGASASMLAQIRAILAEAGETPAPVTVTRYTDITAPGRLAVGRRGW